MTILVVLAIAVSIGVGYQWLGARRDTRRFTPPGVFIDVGGHRIHAVCQGDGIPLVVLESGVAASSVSWVALQPAIATFTRVCAYDRAGLSWSEAPSRPRTVGCILDELAAVIDALGARARLVLVGHSFGSLIVRGFAARHPERVAGLVLVDPPAEWLALTPERARLIRGARWLSHVGAILAHVGIVRACLALLTGGAPGVPRRFVSAFGPTTARTLDRIVGEVRKLPPAVHPMVQALWCQPKCFRAMAGYLGTLEREGPALAASRPPRDIPTIVISSGAHAPAQVAAHRALADDSADGRHVIARRSTHWVHFDEPELIVEAVRSLVELERRRT